MSSGDNERSLLIENESLKAELEQTRDELKELEWVSDKLSEREQEIARYRKALEQIAVTDTRLTTHWRTRQIARDALAGDSEKD